MTSTLPEPLIQQRRQLRQQLRATRRALTPAAQHTASQRLGRQLRRQLWFLRARHLACYLAADGELGLTRLHFLPQQQPYLPCLPGLPGENTLAFAPWHDDECLVPNRLGIAEPPLWRAHAVTPWTLDVMLLPLVAFDRRGNRMGMGGGFYDRLLDRFSRWPRRPLLVGVAHGFQEVEVLPVAPWDQPLDWVVTPDEAIRCRHQ